MWDRVDLPQILQWLESTGNRQEHAPVRPKGAAIRGVVLCLRVCVRPLRACPSFLHAAITFTYVRPFPPRPVRPTHRVPSHLCSFLQFSAWEVFLKGNWSNATFVTDYFPIMFFPVLYIAAKLVTRVRIIKPSEMDFVSDVAEFDAMTCVSNFS